LVKRALFGARGKGKKGLGANFQYGFGFHNSTQTMMIPSNTIIMSGNESLFQLPNIECSNCIF
jgi:hypothetical protein